MEDREVTSRFSRRRALQLLGMGAVVSPAAACSTTASPSGAPAGERPAATTGPAKPTAAAAAAPTAPPVVEAKVSAAPAGGEVVKITAWTIGPDAPSFNRRDNLIAAA